MAVQLWHPRRFKMRPEAKALVIGALLSGDFMQGTRRLTTIIKTVAGERQEDCCMGVACKTAIRDGLTLAVGVMHDFGKPCLSYDGEEYVLPDQVLTWLFALTPQQQASNQLMRMLRDPLTSVKKTDWDGTHYATLSDLNDKYRYTFRQIARVIRRDF